ncbi:MAG: hypothetical protein JO337_00680 [Acidimicrobiales bacterium]|nr:hypothetical protein [Acidimicrobiales bacterium]
MMVLGGVAVGGPAVGALIFVMLPQVVHLSPIDTQIATGAILMLVILVVPTGIVPAIGDGYDLLRRMVLRNVGAVAWARGPAAVVTPAGGPGWEGERDPLEAGRSG